MKIKITGIGSYIPEVKVSNTDFDKHVFLNEDGTPFGYPNEVVINKSHNEVNWIKYWKDWLCCVLIFSVFLYSSYTDTIKNILVIHLI